MDQTPNVDMSKSLQDQITEVLKKRFFLGFGGTLLMGEEHYFDKVSRAIMALVRRQECAQNKLYREALEEISSGYNKLGPVDSEAMMKKTARCALAPQKETED